MAPAREFQIAPDECRRRRLPTLGVRMRIPDGVEVLPQAEGPIIVRCREPGVGELAIELFAAGLLVDRDRILEQMANDAAEAAVSAPAAGRLDTVMYVELAAGPSGYAADVDLLRDEAGARPEFPYLTLLTLAGPDLAAPGGAIVTVRRARMEWPASAEMLASLRLGARDRGVANDARPSMPLVGRRR